MCEENSNDREFIFSIRDNKIVKTLNEKYRVNIELDETNLNRLLKRYFMQKNAVMIKRIDLSKNETAIKLKIKDIIILKEIAKGKTNLEISKLLNVSIHTVKVYISKILRKMDVKDRYQAARKAISENIIDF